MATAKKLPSGSWRVQLYASKTPDGKRRYLSFTANTKKEAEYQALQYQLHYKEVNRDPTSMTLDEAMEKYISSKDGILSPSTIRGYENIRRNNLKGLMPLALNRITQPMVQEAMNQEAKPYTDKRGRQRVRSAKVEGNVMELPVLMGLWLCMRASEISGLTWGCVDFRHKTITIKRALVRDKDNHWVEKGTKTTSSTRTLSVPDYIMEKLAAAKETSSGGDRVVPLSSESMYKRLKTILRKHDLPDIRFHDLRHTAASVMLTLNIPDKYAQARGGWATNHTMKTVYQHTMQSQQSAVDMAIDNYFYNLIEKNEAEETPPTM